MNLNYIYSPIEFEFKRLHHYFPDELYIKLLSFGFSSEIFKPLQKEMDRIYLLKKTESEFEAIEESPFDSTM